MTLFQGFNDPSVKQSSIGLFAAFSAAIVASWMIFLEQGALNPDAVIYLESARLYSDGLWGEGMAMYRWPLYSLLIALMHHLTGIQMELSAHLLTVLLFAATSAGMVTLVREVGGGRTTMLCSLLLLLASPSLVGKLMPMVVREHGAWAFHLWSLVFLLRFFHRPDWHFALAWGVCAFIAMLFRIEFITFLLVLPMVLLARSSLPFSNRMAQFIKCQVLLIFLGLALLLALLAWPGLDLRDLGRLQDPFVVIHRVYDQFAYGLDQKSQVIAEDVLGRFLADYAKTALLLALLYILLIKAITVFGWLPFGLIAIGWKQTIPSLSKDARLFLMGVVGLGLLNGTLILLKEFLLPSRMLAPIGFVFIVLAAFTFERMWRNWRSESTLNWRKHWLFLLVATLVVVQLAEMLLPDGAKKRDEKAFELHAAKWVKQNASDLNRVYFDSTRMAYYAGYRFEHIKQIKAMKRRKGKFKVDEIAVEEYDFATLHIPRNSADLERFLAGRFGEPLATFNGGRRGMVAIYKTHL